MIWIYDLLFNPVYQQQGNMSQFYKKYKNLFMANETPVKRPKSYLKPFQRQMGHRVQFGNHVKYSESFPEVNYRSHPTNRFQEEILPEISRLNQKNYKYLSSAQPALIYATPQTHNKYKKIEKPTYSNPKIMKPYDHAAKYLEESINLYPKPDQTHMVSFNPEQKLQKIKKEPKSSNRPKIKMSTEPDHQGHRSQIDPFRKDYGYPQINYGLIFSEYERENQFQFLNKRIRDIRWIERFHPRGSINMYREALIRRKEGKQKINERRHELKKLLQAQQKQYQKKVSII